jgi:hypothetical protein
MGYNRGKTNAPFYITLPMNNQGFFVTAQTLKVLPGEIESITAKMNRYCSFFPSNDSNSHFVIARRRSLPTKQSPGDTKGIASLKNARNDTILRIAVKRDL